MNNVIDLFKYVSDKKIDKEKAEIDDYFDYLMQHFEQMQLDEVEVAASVLVDKYFRFKDLVDDRLAEIADYIEERKRVEELDE